MKYLTAVALAAVLVACGGQSKDASGSLTVSARSSAVMVACSGDVDSVQMVLWGPFTGAPGDMESIHANATAGAGCTWELHYGKLKAGGYSLDVDAYRNGVGVVYSSHGTPITVVAGHDATTTVMLFGTNAIKPGDQKKNPPVIQSISASSLNIADFETSKLQVVAANATSYAWTVADLGSFDPADAASTTFKPAKAGSQKVTITASNADGKAVADFTMTVGDNFAKGQGFVLDFNHWPTINSLVAVDSLGRVNSRALPHEAMTITVGASDDDHDTLSYSFASTCGTITSIDNVATFVSDSAGACDVSVSVSDGKTGAVNAATTITIAGESVALGPDFFATWISPQHPAPGAIVEAGVVPSTPAGDPWNNAYFAGYTYAWSDSLGSPASAFNPNLGSADAVGTPSDGRAVLYTLPACPAGASTQAITISVVVTNGNVVPATSNSASFSLIEQCP